MALPQSTRVTEAEYLAFERASEEKHEYHQGEIVLMVGGTPAHSRIIMDLAVALGPRLANGACEMFDSGLKVRVREARLYAYPDLTVVCGAARFDEEYGDTLLNPTVIVEVLSPSTEMYDRREKFRAYRALASLREYVLVAQTEPSVEVYTRQENGLWLWREAAAPDEELVLSSLGVSVPLREIYRRVEFT